MRLRRNKTPQAELKPNRTDDINMNTTIEQPAVEHSQPELKSGVIELTISEVDRQTAGPYGDVYNCLLCTALRNRGVNVSHLGPLYASLEHARDWRFDDLMGPGELYFDQDANNAPFYGPNVVGKVVRLRKIA